MNTIIYFVAFAGIVLSAPNFMDEHRGRGNGGLRGLFMPPFLRNVTWEAKKEYYKIIFNKNETIAEQKKDVLEWAKKYDVEDEVNEYNKNVTNIKKELKKNVTELIKALPSDLDEFSKVMENEDQTHAELKQSLKKLVAEKPKEYKILFYAFGEEIFSGHQRDLKELMKGHRGNGTDSEGSNEADSEENN